MNCKETFNKVVDLEKWEMFRSKDNREAFVQMMGLYMGEFSWETVAEWEDGNSVAVGDAIEETFDKFCLDCVLKRHKKNRISAVWSEIIFDDASPNLEEAFIDNGDGTISYDLNDLDDQYAAEMVVDPYDKKTDTTYVITTTKHGNENDGFFLLELVGSYKGKPDITISDTIARRARGEE